MGEASPRRVGLVATLAAFVAIFALGVLRWSPPPPAPLEVAPGDFSAARAMRVLDALAGSGEPRTMGSAALARARAVAERALREAGFEAETSPGFACTVHGACGHVQNVVGYRAGAAPGARAVLLMAHLDSVGAGPGAGDDGLGASAVLEAARALGAAAPLPSPIIVLLSDGEEAGLLGATAFAREHPRAREVGAVVNVDARGSAGPSMLFEASGGPGGGDAWLAAQAASRLARPVTASLFAEIYRRMPNDTDFTVFRERARGVNFGNVAGVERYHTANDVVEGVAPGTLQHHGDQVLAMTRALGEADLARPEPGDAVWFDVLSFGIVRWPARLTWALALAALAGLVARAVRHRRAPSARAALAATAALASGLASTVLAGGALRALGALPAPWLAHPLPALVAVHAAALAGGLAAAHTVAHATRRRGTSPEGVAPWLWLGTWLLWAALGVAVTAVAPGASYLFVVPALVAAASGGIPGGLARAAPAIAAALLWLPLARPLYVVLGLVAPPVVALPSLLSGVALVPFLLSPLARAARLRVLSLALALVVVPAAFAVALPPFSTAVPQRVNVLVRQGESGPARAFVSAAWGAVPWGRVPEAMARAQGPVSEAVSPLAGLAPAGASELPRLAAPGPGVDVLEPPRTEGAARRVRARLRARGPSRMLALELAEDRDVTVRVEGRLASPRGRLLVLRGVPDDGVELDVEARGSAPITMAIADVTLGLAGSPEAETLAASRPPEAVPTQEGDVVLTVTDVAW